MLIATGSPVQREKGPSPRDDPSTARNIFQPERGINRLARPHPTPSTAFLAVDGEDGLSFGQDRIEDIVEKHALGYHIRLYLLLVFLQGFLYLLAENFLEGSRGERFLVLFGKDVSHDGHRTVMVMAAPLLL